MHGLLGRVRRGRIIARHQEPVRLRFSEEWKRRHVAVGRSDRALHQRTIVVRQPGDCVWLKKIALVLYRYAQGAAARMAEKESEVERRSSGDWKKVSACGAV